MGKNNENENVSIEPPKNQEGKYVIDKNNPSHIRWLHQQQANRGAKHVNQGRKEVLDKAAERSVPLAAAALVGSAVAAPVVTGLSLAGGYLGSQLGEWVSPEKYKREGQVIGGTLGGITAPGLKMLPQFIAGDPYTTLGGRFGYYGNKFERVYHTLARRMGWKTSPKHPELLRKIQNTPEIKDGKVQITNPGDDFTNFSTDRPVVSHSKGDWDPYDLYITDPKVVEGLNPISIEPSDMFYVGPNITAKPNQVTLVSGNTTKLINAQDAGMSTLSSPRLRELWDKMNRYYYAELRRQSLETSPLKRRLFKKGFKDIVPPSMREPYAQEIQRLQTLRGTPTLEDYNYISKLYGLDPGIVGISQMNPEIIRATFKPGVPMYYPNGRELDMNYFTPTTNNEKALLEKSQYNNVFYDPASYVEDLWKINNGYK